MSSNTPLTARPSTAVVIAEVSPASGLYPPFRARRHWRRRLPVLSRLVLLVAILVYTLPLIYLLITALKSDSEFHSHPVSLAFHPTPSNFSAAWKEGNFGAFALNSVLYSLVGSLISCVTALFIAFPVARRYVRGSGAFQLLFVVALFLPNSLVAQYQLLLHLHLYNTRFGYLILLASTLGVAPLLLVGYIRSIPVELDEAASLDGVGYFRYVISFIAPLALPALVTAFILQAITFWNEIILATLVLADPSKSPVSKGLFAFSGPYGSQVSLLAAASLIVAGPLILLYVALQRYIVAGALGGSFKG